MMPLNILIIGGGIGGLTSAVALRRDGHSVTVIEKDPSWTVYGVGIIQQANVVRAMSDLGLLDEYLSAGVGFDAVEIYAPQGAKVARVPSPKLKPEYPANVGVARPALHEVLVSNALRAGAIVRTGVTADDLHDLGDRVVVTFSDEQQQRFDLVIGADGIYSQTRERLFPDAPKPTFTGQSVWRYNLPRPVELDAMHVYNGATGVGLVPIGPELMYMYATTAEPGNPRYSRDGLAAIMRGKLSGSAPRIRELAELITQDDEVVYRPLEVLMFEGPWHKGRIVLIGDAVHATTPHLGQGAGMAIEDSIVLADEIATHDDIEDALVAFRDRRIERCRYIVERSLEICHGQLGKGPQVDNAKAAQDMFRFTAEPV